MAAVLQRKGKRKKTWYAIFRDLNGRQRWVKLESKTRQDAQKAADVLEDTSKRRKSAQHIRAAFADLYHTFYGEGSPVSTVRTFMTSWLNQKKPETSQGTYLAYKKTVEAFLAALGPRADGDIAEVTRKDLVEFRNALATNRASDTTNRYVVTLRMIFRAAHRDGFVLENPAEHVDTVKDTGGEGRRPFTIPELQAVLEVADDEWKSLVKFGLYTGQRLGDLAALTWANVDLNRGEIRLTARKTGKRLTIPISSALASHLAQLPSSDHPSSPIHPRAFGIVQSQGRSATLSNQFSELLVAAGLRDKVSHASRGIGRDSKRAASALSFHSLRHTAVSLLKDAGVPQAVVQELIGHDSAAMSALYTHVGTEQLRKAAASLPEI